MLFRFVSYTFHYLNRLNHLALYFIFINISYVAGVCHSSKCQKDRLECGGKSPCIIVFWYETINGVFHHPLPRNVILFSDAFNFSDVATLVHVICRESVTISPYFRCHWEPSVYPHQRLLNYWKFNSDEQFVIAFAK